MKVGLITVNSLLFASDIDLTSPDVEGAIQVLRNADGGGGHIFKKKRYEGVMFNVISVTRGWVGVQFSEKIALRNTWMAPEEEANENAIRINEHIRKCRIKINLD